MYGHALLSDIFYMDTVLSLFDFTGNWSAPFRQVADVVQIDLKHGQNLMAWDYQNSGLENVVGILAAVPCTDFSIAGAQYWAAKDADGRTAASVALCRRTLEIVEFFNPKFWVIENPVGRIEKCVPELCGKCLLEFHPHEFGDGYTKKTRLWGHFNPMLVRKHVKPISQKMTEKGGCRDYSIELFYGKKGKAIRDITPPGFAKAFFEAQRIYF